MKFLLGSFVTLLLVGLSTQSTPFTKCDKGSPPIYLQINNCTEQPCVIQKDNVFQLETNFTLSEDALIVIPQLFLSVGYWEGYVPVPQMGCDGMKNTRCPLKAGQDITYGLSMTMPAQLPDVDDGELMFSLEGMDDPFFCFKTKFVKH